MKPYVFARDLMRAKKEEPADQEAGYQEALEEEVISEAVLQAGDILDAARKEAQTIYEEARRNGYEEGLKAGRKTGFEEARREHEEKLSDDREALRKQMETYITGMEKEKSRLLDRYLNDLRDIAVAIAEKVIRISLKTSSETMKLMIVSATAGLRKKEWARIHISKYNVDLMMEGDAEFLDALSYLSDHVRIIKMEEEEGSCIVELPDEIIDLSVNTQMANIKELLENA